MWCRRPNVGERRFRYVIVLHFRRSITSAFAAASSSALILRSKLGDIVDRHLEGSRPKVSTPSRFIWSALLCGLLEGALEVSPCRRAARQAGIFSEVVAGQFGGSFLQAVAGDLSVSSSSPSSVRILSNPALSSGAPVLRTLGLRALPVAPSRGTLLPPAIANKMVPA